MTKGLKDFVHERAQHCCEYCAAQVRYSADSFSLEHIVPLALHGLTIPENLALSCQGCNNHKGVATHAADPATGLLQPLFNPRQDAWTQHFTWTEDFTAIVGLTPTGRATVSRLQLNRFGLVNLREMLVAFGKHPPGEFL